MELLKVLLKDKNWTKALLTGKRKLSASDRSELEARRGGKILADILYQLFTKPKNK